MRPRDWCGGKTFRDANSDDWQPTSGDDPVDLARAWRHFRLAKSVQASIDNGAVNLKDIAKWLDQAYETPRRKLAGDEPADGRDLALWELIGSPDDDPGGDLDGLFPPGTEVLLGRWTQGRGNLPILSSTSSAAAPLWGNVAQVLMENITRIEDAGLLEIFDRHALRFAVSEALIEGGPDAADLGIDGQFLTLGVPSRAIIGGLLVRAPATPDKASAAALLLDVSERLVATARVSGPMTVLFVVSDARGRAVVSSLLPASLLSSRSSPGTLHEIGPFDPALGLDPDWSQSTCGFTVIATAVADPLVVSVVQIGKLVGLA